MKAKILFALTALLMLGSVSLNAQENGNSSNSESKTQLEGDLNHDNKVDVADVTYLVNIIMKNQSEAKDGTYYWYIGVDNPTTISNIQTDNTKPGWHEIGTSLSGFELHTTNNPIEFTSKTRYYLVIPNELNVYDDDETDGKYIFGNNTIECNIPGYKAYQYYNQYGVWDVTGIIIKEGIPVSGVSISTSESSINVGNTLQLEATVSPSNATNQNVTWSSSNPEIATVDETTGLVTGVSIGTTTIIATSVSGSKTATTRVEVVDQLSNYYWYIGTTLPTSISNIQTDNTKPGWHSISSLAGFRLDTTGNKSNRIYLSYEDTGVIGYYVIIPNELNIYDSNEDNGYYMFTDASYNMSGYKAFKYNSQDEIWTVKGIIIK